MKKLFTYLIAGCLISLSIQAQENKPGQPIGGIIVKGGRNPGGNLLVNVGGGITNPSSNSQSELFLGSGFNLNAGLYSPILSVKDGKIIVCGQTDHFFTVGPNVSGTFYNFKGDVNASPIYNIYTQTSPPTASSSGNANASAYTLEAGIHANFSFGKVTFSPVLNGAYFSFQQDAFSVTQTNQVDGKPYKFDIYSQQKTKQSGFAFIPKLRIGYFPGKMGFYLESNYNMGPEINSQSSTLKPSSPGKENTYELDQLSKGTQVASERHTPFHNLAVNFGLSYTIKKSKTKLKNQPQNQSIINTTKSNTKDKVSTGLEGTDATNPSSQPQNQSIVNTTKSNTKDRIATGIEGNDGTNPSSQPQNQSIVNTTKSNTKDRVSTTIDGTDSGTNPSSQPQNQSIINTTKSNTKDRVSTTIDGTDTGTNPSFQPQNQSIINTSKSNTKDRVETSNDNNNTQMMPLVYNGQNEILKESKLSILGTGETLANGTPIVSGRVVKGKITGSIIIASSNRVAPTVTIKQPESGDEGSAVVDKEGNFSITLGSDTTHRVYINNQEFGKIKIESGDGNIANKPGGPIGGIIVKGGKNPGGQMRLVSNNNGEFTFDNPQTADFQFKIETPETKPTEGTNARPGEPIGGIIVKGGRNPGGQLYTLISDANGVITLKNLPAGNYTFRVTVPTKAKSPVYESSGNSGENPLFEASSLARPGEPIGGIIVKGGKNPGGQMRLVSNNNGEFTFENPQTADFQFKIETPETKANEGTNARPGEPIGGIVVKGGRNPGGQLYTLISDANGVVTLKNLPAGNYTFRVSMPTKTENPVYESSGNSVDNPLFEASSLARPGGPIGGIVVKGGKNPGGQMRLVSNNNGEFTFDNPQTADFQFKIEIPETKTNEGTNARPGEPIGGIIVKGGRNPGGQLYTLVSDANGVITLKNLPTGNYTFRVSVPTKAENPLYKANNSEALSPLYKGK